MANGSAESLRQLVATSRERLAELALAGDQAVLIATAQAAADAIEHRVARGLETQGAGDRELKGPKAIGPGAIGSGAAEAVEPGAGGFQDGGEWVEQLRVAARVFE